MNLIKAWYAKKAMDDFSEKKGFGYGAWQMVDAGCVANKTFLYFLCNPQSALMHHRYIARYW